MNNQLTEVVCIIDESGSMFGLTEETISGFNKFLDEQRATPGEAKITLVLFNDGPPRTIWNGVPLTDCPKLSAATYKPGGFTALLDAMGTTIDTVGKRLAATPEAQRPGKVIFLVITDGCENVSKEFTRRQVFDKIKTQREVFSWEFVYLGANQDAIQEGSSFGFQPNKSINFMATEKGLGVAYGAVSRGLSAYRTQDQSVVQSFLDTQNLGEEDPQPQNQTWPAPADPTLAVTPTDSSNS